MVSTKQEPGGESRSTSPNVGFQCESNHDDNGSRRQINSEDSNRNDGSTSSEEERGATPLPTKKVVMIALVTYTNAFCLSVIFPMLPFMTHDFFPYLSATQLGIYSGFLGGAFSGGSFFGNIFWGRFADIYGRRPALLLGILGTMVTIVFFGFSISFIWAVCFRLLWGALNGNIAVAKTYLSEVCDDSNLAKGFSVLGSAAAIGRLTGPIAAGFFSCPALKFDALNIAILRNFPYLLPCLICIILCIFALIGSFVYLEETMADMTEVYADIPASHSDLRSPVEEPANENLINHNQDTQDITKYSINTPDDEVNVSKRRAWFCCGCCPCAKKRYHRFGEKENSLTCFGRCKIGVHKIVQPMKDRRVYLLTIIQCLLAFVAGVHAELIPLLLVTDYKHGGYDLDTSEISFMYSLMSVIEVIYQLAVYPSIVKNIGFKHTLKVGLVMFGVTASLIPTLNRIAGPISRPSTHNITILLPLNTASAEEITSLEDNVQKRVEDLTLSSETETDLLHHSNTLHFMSTDNEQIVNSKITYGNSLMNNTKPKYSDLQLSAVPWTNVTDNLIKQCKLLSESRKDEHVSLWRIPVKVWAVLVVFITASTISRMTAFVSMNVLVGNACLAKDKGTVYGVAQSLTALVRSTAPAVGGNIFAWSEHNDLPWPFDYHLTFYLLSVILIFTCFVSCLLPTSVNKKRTEEDTIA